MAVLDGLEPVIFTTVRGGSGLRVFQTIAAGLIGRDAALAGGAPTVALGMALHLFIASAVVTVYWLASGKMSALRRRPIVYGMLYGLVVFVVMNYVVIPLSALGTGLRIPAITLSPAFLNGIFATLVCVGIPTGLAARAAARETAPLPL